METIVCDREPLTRTGHALETRFVAWFACQMRSVYVSSLEAVASVADGIATALPDSGPDSLAGVSTEAVGHGELATALADFADEWGRGVRQMIGDGQRFVAELNATAEEYRRNEDVVARSVRTDGTD